MTVAYLAGPEPLNDFRVLTALGVLPQNIYGFASDNSSFNNALAQVPLHTISQTGQELNNLLRCSKAGFRRVH